MDILESKNARSSDIVVGPSIAFEDRGEHALKGVPGELRLYVVKS